MIAAKTAKRICSIRAGREASGTEMAGKSGKRGVQHSGSDIVEKSGSASRGGKGAEMSENLSITRSMGPRGKRRSKKGGKVREKKGESRRMASREKDRLAELFLLEGE